MSSKYEELMDRFPKLFRQRNLDKMQTCMCWGIECGDGWFPILEQLCSHLQWDVDNNKYPQTEFTQIKEKFGTLRIYYDIAISEEILSADPFSIRKQGSIEGAIAFAEGMSSTMCESCGSTKNVATEGKGWITTLCAECREKRNK